MVLPVLDQPRLDQGPGAGLEVQDLDGAVAASVLPAPRRCTPCPAKLTPRCRKVAITPLFKMHTLSQINLIKNAKSNFLLWKKFKDTESAHLWGLMG